jgi:hypothetical protein
MGRGSRASLPAGGSLTFGGSGVSVTVVSRDLEHGVDRRNILKGIVGVKSSTNSSGCLFDYF